MRRARGAAAGNRQCANNRGRHRQSDRPRRHQTRPAPRRLATLGFGTRSFGAARYGARAGANVAMTVPHWGHASSFPHAANSRPNIRHFATSSIPELPGPCSLPQRRLSVPPQTEGRRQAAVEFLGTTTRALICQARRFYHGWKLGLEASRLPQSATNGQNPRLRGPDYSTGPLSYGLPPRPRVTVAIGLPWRGRYKGRPLHASFTFLLVGYPLVMVKFSTP